MKKKLKLAYFALLILVLITGILLLPSCGDDDDDDDVDDGDNDDDDDDISDDDDDDDTVNPAHTVLVNGKFYTGNKEKSQAEAVAIKDGIIVYVGSMEGVDHYIGQQTEVIDLEGKFAMPAFVDAHMHPSANAYAYLFTAALFDLSTHEEYIAKIREFAEANPDLEGIMGSGFKRSLYDAIGPRKEWLDAIDSTRPIGVMDLSIHSMWVNSKTLEVLGITKNTPDPPGGHIQKDPVTGEPTGLLIEYAAYNPAWELMPVPTLEKYKTGLLWLQDCVCSHPSFSL